MFDPFGFLKMLTNFDPAKDAGPQFTVSIMCLTADEKLQTGLFISSSIDLAMMCFVELGLQHQNEAGCPAYSVILTKTENGKEEMINHESRKPERLMIVMTDMQLGNYPPLKGQPFN